MARIISALDFLVVMLACALNERRQDKLDYTQQEVRVLEEVIEARTEVCEIVNPRTILAGFRKLVAQKYDGSDKRGPGRPRTAADRRQLIIEIAEANRTWGYTKIRDALRAMKTNVGRTTIADILVPQPISLLR